MGSHGRESYLSRRKWAVLTDRDELAFSRVIREYCPDVMFWGQIPGGNPYDESTLPSIAHCGGGSVSIVLPAPGQEKRWQLNKAMGQILVSPLVGFALDRSKWEWVDPSKKWTFDPPLFGLGELGIYFPHDDKTLKNFAGRLLRLMNKVTWKDNIFGLDACLWSQSGGEERRGLGSGELIDPSEKIELNKYYDDSLWDDSLPETPAWDRNIEPPLHLKRLWGIE